MASSTITDLKRGFLIEQIRLLGAPLRPDDQWRERDLDDEDEQEHDGDEEEAGGRRDLKKAVVEEVVHKVNGIVRHHARSTYSSQTVRYVAERIDQMYLASQREVDTDRQALIEEGNPVNRDSDLRLDEVIVKLPDQWPIEDDVEDDTKEEHDGFYSDEDETTTNAGLNAPSKRLRRYMHLHRQLSKLSEQRRMTRQKLERYRHLQQLLQPYRNPLQTVQPNLLYLDHDTRRAPTQEGQPGEMSTTAGQVEEGSYAQDDELARELAQMRELLARVGGRINGLKSSRAGGSGRSGRERRMDDGDDEADFDDADDERIQKKVEEILRKR